MNDLIVMAYLREIIEEMIDVDADSNDLKILKEVKINLHERIIILKDCRGNEYHLSIELK
jgi:hypothetical protein